MYSAERKQEILLMLEKNTRVHVDQLASYFGVSRSSIRRDLNHLHEDGLLSRTYGGAVALHNGSAEAPRIGDATAPAVERQTTRTEPAPAPEDAAGSPAGRACCWSC